MKSSNDSHTGQIAALDLNGCSSYDKSSKIALSVKTQTMLKLPDSVLLREWSTSFAIT